MKEPMRPRHIPHDELELLEGPVLRAGGELRQLRGDDYGLVTSVMSSRVPPGLGPRRHRHPHSELFVVQEGEVRYEVDGTTIDARAGDMVIVPADAWHHFTNTGTADLHLTAIHENPRAATEFEDGTGRD